MNATFMTTNNLLSNIGKMIASERTAQHLTQNMLAQRAGISVRTVRNIESAKNSTLDVIFVVFKALGLENLFSNFVTIPQQRVSPYDLWKSTQQK